MRGNFTCFLSACSSPPAPQPCSPSHQPSAKCRPGSAVPSPRSMTAAGRSSGLGRSCCGRQFRMQHQAQTDFRLRGCKRRRGGRLVWSLGRGQGGRINRGLGKRAIPAPSFRHRSGDVPMHCPAAPPDDEDAGRRYRMSGRRGGDRLSARVLTRRQTCGTPAIEIDTQREGKCDAT